MRGVHDLRSYGRGWLVAAALCVLPLSALAVNKGNIGKASVNSTGNSAQIGPAGAYPGGSLIPVSPNVGGFTYAGNYGVPPTATGTTMNMDTKGNVFIAGQKYPFQAGYGAPWADFAKNAVAVVGTMGCSLVTSGVGTAACAVTVPVAVPMIWDWMTKAKVRINSTGGLEQQDPMNFPVSDGWDYRANAPSVTAWFRTGIQACQAAMAAYNLQHSTTDRWTFRNPVWVSTFNCNGELIRADGSSAGVGHMANLERTPSTGCSSGMYVTPEGCTFTPPSTWRNVSGDQAASAMGGINPDPKVWGEILEKGGEVTLPTPTVTGPSTIQGPETVKQNADGTKEVSRTTYNFNTAGNTITNTSNVTTTNYYNSSNVQTGTKTETTTPTAGSPPDEQPEEGQCDKYPDTLGCADLKTPEAQIPKAEKTLTYTAENPFGPGSCPSDKSMVSQLAARSFKVVDWAQACSYTALYVRPVILVLSLISAFFIISLGKDPE